MVRSGWAVAALALILVGCSTGETAGSSDPTPAASTTSAAPISTLATSVPAPSSTRASSTAASSASSTATEPSEDSTTSSTSTTTTDPPVDPMMLAADGFGAVSFGDHVDDVMVVLVDRLGAASNDDVYESPFANLAGWNGDDRGPAACHVATGGYGCFDYLRLVWWEDAYFGVVFSDLEVDTNAVPGDKDYPVQVPPSFHGYHYGGGDESPLLYTGDGITVGSPIADLLRLGDRVSFSWNPCGSVVEFAIDGGPEATEPFIHGSLDDHDVVTFEATGQPNPNATVQSLRAGMVSSC